MNITFKAWVERWREAKKQTSRNRARPEWIKPSIRGRSAQDLYKSDVSVNMKQMGDLEYVPEKEKLKAIQETAMARWDLEDDETRTGYVQKAAAEKKFTGQAHGRVVEKLLCPASEEGEQQNPVLPEGPLHLASVAGRFPIEPEEIEKHQDRCGFDSCVQKLATRRG